MWYPELRPGQAKYRAIVEALARAVEQGELRMGDRLPPQREMAWKLRVNLATVSKAYSEATRRHLITGEVGRGTFVLASSSEAKLFMLRKSQKAVIDLSTNVPAAFEDEGSLATAVAALSPSDKVGIDGYASPELLERGCTAVRRWLQWRGLTRSGDAVILTSGAQAGLMATLLSVRQAHPTVLVEAHTFPGMKAIARHLGLKIVGVECDGEGVLPEALASQARGTGARLAVLVPNLQNPTGSTMGTARRKDVAAVAKALDILIIEDDVYGPLTQCPPLQEELGGQGIIIGSLSKSVLPGLRFGFISGSAAEVASLNDVVHATSWFTSALSLTVSTRWIDEGSAFQRVAWQREEISRRWDLMCQVLGPFAGVPSPHAWLAAPEGSDVAVARCRELGVEIVPASIFSVGRRDTQKVRVCLTAARSSHTLMNALECIREAGVKAPPC